MGNKHQKHVRQDDDTGTEEAPKVKEFSQRPTAYKSKKRHKHKYPQNVHHSSDSDANSYSSNGKKISKNEKGGTTIVTNKTVVGGNFTTIGRNANNVTVTINNSGKGSVKSKRPKQMENHSEATTNTHTTSNGLPKQTKKRTQPTIVTNKPHFEIPNPISRETPSNQTAKPNEKYPGTIKSKDTPSDSEIPKLMNLKQPDEMPQQTEKHSEETNAIDNHEITKPVETNSGELTAQEKSSERQRQCEEFSLGYYSSKDAREEEKKLCASPMLPSALPGNFTGDHERIYSIEAMETICSWSYSVGHILFPGGSATGFRVGENTDSGPYYFMTALHVLMTILGQDYPLIGSHQENLGNPEMYVVFGHTSDDDNFDEKNKFYFQTIVHFEDEETDCTILELKPNMSGAAMPKPFPLLAIPKLDESFNLIGHANGNKKECYSIKGLLNTSLQQTQNDIDRVKLWSRETHMRDYEAGPYNVLTNPSRFLFHCPFTNLKGASGAPGIALLADMRVVVMTMLICGFPNWYYEPDLDQTERDRVPSNCLVEQGTSMVAIYDKMRRGQYNGLCTEIFG